jgi:hypothetical protein
MSTNLQNGVLMERHEEVIGRQRAIKPYLLVSLLFCLLFTILTFAQTTQVIILDCTRVEIRIINCRFTKTVAGFTIQDVKIDRLRAAQLDVNQTERKGQFAVHYRVTLQHSEGIFTVTDFYGSKETELPEIVSRINTYIVDTEQPALHTQFPNPPTFVKPIGWLSFWFIFLAGAIMYDLTKSSPDKPQKIRFRNRR